MPLLLNGVYIPLFLATDRTTFDVCVFSLVGTEVLLMVTEKNICRE
jgi:hypothetical protein